ncbi:GTP 3',8-cyclase [Sinobacterium norvegicum]|uniref:GTP 3',8-cyclase n=1 Tax=Sinobacterium norvegicum TaxID=1641715 RepID=A0ABM9AF64_9GAMM|nr:GTP 3',8-cyclase MoaA [Sinobacterium norvegicum]CAH0991833.1 GTP 3',8-cyclase [Sinobacterium norvegicum]
MTSSMPTSLIDKFNRRVDYVRMSVTDRCDFRCVYCMAEEMTFLPREQVLTLEEMAFIARAFTELGVKKIRLTGGEPLIRKNVITLFQQLGDLDGLQELNLTSNGSQLTNMAKPLVEAGVSRINISLDTLKADKFKELTRTGNLDTVIAGIDAAIAAGFSRIKLNAVVLKGRNDDEILDLVNFAISKGVDISFIEEMPLGNISEHDRALSFCSSDDIQEIIAQQYPLTEITATTAGPSRYFSLAGESIRVGFISPHSHNFCGDCNRVRVTVEGRLLLCLGNEHSVDLRHIIRANPGDIKVLKQAIIDSLDIKPERHYFDLEQEVQIVRFMNTTGG